MHTIVETPEFIRCTAKLGLTEDERKEIVDTIARNPILGEVIKGTGGARKVRIAASKKKHGKSGGYRVITFYTGKDIPVFLLSAYAKSQKDDLTQDERNSLKVLLNLLTITYKKGK